MQIQLKPSSWIALCGIALLPALSHADLIVHYDFANQSAQNTAPGAAAGTNASGASAAVYENRTPAGPGGYSFDTQGSNYLYASGQGSVGALANKSAITISMWFNLQGNPEQYDRLISWQSSATGLGSGFTLNVTNASPTAQNFNLDFSVTGSSAGTINVTEGGLNKWLFLAVTFDGSLGKADRVSYYIGTADSQVLAKTATGNGTDGTNLGNGINAGGTYSELRIAGTQASAVDRAPDALFSDVRIYDSSLSLQELEAIRLQGITQVPEPALTGAAVAAAVLSAVTAARRKRRNNA